jgi:spore germination protein GerM
MSFDMQLTVTATGSDVFTLLRALNLAGLEHLVEEAPVKEIVEVSDFDKSDGIGLDMLPGTVSFSKPPKRKKQKRRASLTDIQKAKIEELAPSNSAAKIAKGLDIPYNTVWAFARANDIQFGVKEKGGRPPKN